MSWGPSSILCCRPAPPSGTLATPLCWPAPPSGTLTTSSCWPAPPSGILATPSCCIYNIWYTFLALGIISMLLKLVLCLLTPCVTGVMSSFKHKYSLPLVNLGTVFKSFWCGGSYPILGDTQGHVGKKNICVSLCKDAELIGGSFWHSGFCWSGFVGWGVILLLCAPLVAGETIKYPIPDYTGEDASSKMPLLPFLSPYAYLSITGFLALGLVLPRVVPHLGGYCALGSLAEALIWGVPAVSAVAGFDSQALYQHIFYWLGYRLYTYIPERINSSKIN